MLHNESSKTTRDAASGPTCFICHRRGGKPARVRVDIGSAMVSDEQVVVCVKCATDRFRVLEMARRVA